MPVNPAGSPAMPINPRVRIQSEDFDLSTEVAALRAGDGGAGAITSFVEIGRASCRERV